MYSTNMRRISSAPDVKTTEKFPDEMTFYHLLDNFNRRQHRIHPSLPSVLGTPVDLYVLFISVVKRGGYAKVTERDLWESVAADINCSACTNSSVALRRIYCQHLIAYEHESYPNLRSNSVYSQIPDEFHEDAGEVYVTPSVEKMLGIFTPRSSPLHYGIHRSSTSLGFGYRQDPRLHSSFDQLPPALQLEELHSRPHPSNIFNLKHATILENAEKSLLSGLPNEVDLTLNSIMFLSAVIHPSPATPLRLSSSRNLLALMLAAVGIYEDGPGSLKPLAEVWKRASKLDFEKFWRDSVGSWILSALSDDAYLYQEHAEPLVQDAETAGYRVAPMPTPESTTELFEPSPPNLGRLLWASADSSEDCVATNSTLSRVLTVVVTLVNCVTPPHIAGLPPPLEEDDDDYEQVMAFASVDNNRRDGEGGCAGRAFRGRSLVAAPGVPPLSTWRENARLLASTPAALRFAFLCAYARHSALRQLGLQLVASLRYPLVPFAALDSPPTAVAIAASVSLPELHANTFTGLELVSVRFLVRCLMQSYDRCDILAGLSLLTNLLRVPEGVNVDRLFSSLPRSIWLRLLQLLCLSDLAVVCGVLEALLSLTGMSGGGGGVSSSSSSACARLWSALDSADETVSQHAPATVFAPRRASTHLRPLLALLTLEGQAMGPASLRRVKVLQRIPPPQPLLQPQPLPVMPMPAGVVRHPPGPMPQQQLQQQQHFVRPRPPMPPPLPPSGPHLGPPQAPPNPTPSLASLLEPSTCPHNLQHHRPHQPLNHQHQPHFGQSPVRSRGVVSFATPPPPAPPPQLAGAPAGGGGVLSPMLMKVPPSVAKVKPEASSLSELTDRLQMPPPQAPPPRRTVGRSVNGNSSSSSTLSTASSALLTAAKPPAMVNGMATNSPLVNHKHQNNKSSNQGHTNTNSSSSDSTQKTAVGGGSGNNISKSLLEEVLNSTSTEKQSTPPPPPLLNGDNTSPPLRLVNGTREAKKLTAPPPLVNGCCAKSSKKGEVEEAKEEKEEERMEEPSEAKEALLQECATFYTHYLCYNRHVGYHYTRKRPRNFALRNRVIVGSGDGPSTSAKRRRRRLVAEAVRKAAAAVVASAAAAEEEEKAKASASQLSAPEAPQPNQAPDAAASTPLLACEWAGCQSKFPYSKQVSSHVYSCHLKPLMPTRTSESCGIERRCCHWADCPTQHVPRAPYALMTHVIECHCGPAVLESRRHHHLQQQQQHNNGSSNRLQQPPLPPIVERSGVAVVREVEMRRYCCQMGGLVPPPLPHHLQAGMRGHGTMLPPQAPREGPVTKHLRVTAALIIRNLARHVPEARRWLLSESQLLSEVAMGSCPSGNVSTSSGACVLRTNDASRIISQCLAICSEPSSSSSCSSHDDHLQLSELLLLMSGNEAVSYCRCRDCLSKSFFVDTEEEDEQVDVKAFFGEGSSSSSSSSISSSKARHHAHLRQKSSVDLDA